MSDDLAGREPEDEFAVAVRNSYQLGKRLKHSPLFKHADIRKYKRLHEKEVERLHRQTGNGHNEEELTFVDHSLLGHFAVGSAAYNYYNSWPKHIVLSNAKWEVVVRSRHCPFCSPSGRCDTLKDLMDHLESHHQQFAYRAKRNPDDSAVIMLKLRENRWIENDLMFRVSTEGYLISSRKRKKFPKYVPKVMKRRDLDFPFFVQLCKPPKTYRELASLPSAVSVNNVRRTRPKRTLTKSKSTGTIQSGHTTQTASGKADMSSAKKTKKRKEVRRVTTAIGRATPKVTTKRKVVAEPTGMGNRHSIHFRNVMFGNQAHLRSAGEGCPSRLTHEAAHGRLYSTVTNVPLDIETYNAGYDSDIEDGGAESAWRLEHHDDHIGSFIDVLPIEKYFSILWDSFVLQYGRVKSDRAVYALYIGFVQKHGGELKRMKLEVVFAMQVVLSWKHGLVDAKGVMAIMKMLRECKPTGREEARANSTLIDRLEREQESPFKDVHKYSEPTRRARKKIRNPALLNWLENEKAAQLRLTHAMKAVDRGREFARSWMCKVADVEADETE